MLDDRPIKIQLSEAGKKKSANKKNILKQKNRKLAEMRNEVTTDHRSVAIQSRLIHFFTYFRQSPFRRVAKTMTSQSKRR